MPKISANQLIKEGASVVDELHYYPDREKVSGRMWGGNITLKKDGIEYHFKMWHHGGYSMTPDEALSEMDLEGVRTKDGEYHDAYWTTIQGKDGSLYLHSKKNGWFGDRSLEGKLFKDTLGKKTGEDKAVFEYHQNYNWQEGDDITPEVSRKLRDLGFIQIAGPPPGEPEGTKMQKYMGTEIAVRPGETARQAAQRLDAIWKEKPAPVKSRRTAREAARKRRQHNSGPSARGIK